MYVDSPFFSVVTTTFNREKLLERALNSLINQTEKDWEAIIINDGSTDQTEELVKRFLKKAAPIKYTYQENKGFIAGKNAGIKRARGRYITFLDSDDAYKPYHLASRKQLLLADKSIDLLHGGVQIIGPEYVPDAADPTKMIHLNECAISGTFFIKNKCMQELNGFSGNSISTDADFMSRAQEKGLTIVKTDIPSYIYHRDLESSITLDFLKKRKIH